MMSFKPYFDGTAVFEKPADGRLNRKRFWNLTEFNSSKRVHNETTSLHAGCYRAFGMETFHIPDSQITASSYKKYHEPAQARLHMGASASGNGAWCAGQSYQQGEWLQVTCMTSFPFLLTFQERIKPPYLQQYQVMIGRWRGVGYCGHEFHNTAADLFPVHIIKVGGVLKFGQFHAQLHPRSFTSNSREERESRFDDVTGRHEFRNKFLCWTQAMLLHCVGRSRRKENSNRDCHSRKAGLLRQRMDYTPRCFGKFRSGQLVSSIWWKGILKAHMFLPLLLLLSFSCSCIKVGFAIISVLDLLDVLRR